MHQMSAQDEGLEFIFYKSLKATTKGKISWCKPTLTKHLYRMIHSYVKNIKSIHGENPWESPAVQFRLNMKAFASGLKRKSCFKSLKCAFFVCNCKFYKQVLAQTNIKYEKLCVKTKQSNSNSFALLGLIWDRLDNEV